MIDHVTFSNRELLAELAHLDLAIRDAPTVVDPADFGSALSPQFLGLLSQQLLLIGELRSRRAQWRATVTGPAAPDAAPAA